MSYIQYFSLIFLILKGNDFICIGLINIIQKIKAYKFVVFSCLIDFLAKNLSPHPINDIQDPKRQHNYIVFLRFRRITAYQINH
jgi:hypothetical protein